MEIRLNTKDVAALFSTLLRTEIQEQEVTIDTEVTLHSITLDKLMRLQALTTATPFKAVEKSAEDAEEPGDESGSVDLLTMEALHAQNMQLASKPKGGPSNTEGRPLGPDEAYTPPASWNTPTM